MTQDTTTTPTSGAADLLAMVSKALREAYNLGQRYWQQADSEYISQHKKADDTRAKFLALVEETCAALAVGQATAAPAQPAAQQPHRSGCTAGTDEECVQRGCGTNCPAVAPKADSRPAPVLDERDDFEKVFHLPSGCVRVGTGYAATGYSNWAAHTHCERWQGWQARAARDPADSVQEDAMRYRLLRRCKGQEHEPPFTVQHEIDGTLWGGDLDAAIDSARQGRSPA